MKASDIRTNIIYLKNALKFRGPQLIFLKVRNQNYFQTFDVSL